MRGFSDVRKAAADVKDVTVDWAPFFAPGTSNLVSHSVATELGDVAASDITDSATPAMAQKIRLTGGAVRTFTRILCTAAVVDGETRTRSFDCLVR